MRITPITTMDIIRYRQVANTVVDTFTNKVLYKGSKASKMLDKVNQIGLLNANLIDHKQTGKLLSFVA